MKHLIRIECYSTAESVPKFHGFGLPHPLAVNLCTQVVDGNEERVVLESFRMPGTAK